MKTVCFSSQPAVARHIILPNRRRFLVVILIGCGVLLAGCKTSRPSMSVEEAGNIEVRFEKTSMASPPRALGPFLEKFVVQYVNEDRVDRAEPREKLSRSDIDLLISELTKNDWRVSLVAFEEYLNGNLPQAIQIANRATGMGGKQSRWQAYADAARYLAEAGDFDTAQNNLNRADMIRVESSTWRNKHYQTNLSTQYSHYFAKGTVAYSRGDMEEARENYFQALSQLQNLTWRTRGPWRRAQAEIGIAQSYLWQGKFLEAENWARKAVATLEWYRIMPTSIEGRLLPHAFLVLSQVFFEQGRFKDSLMMAHVAFSMVIDLSAPRDSVIRARTRIAIARSYMALGHWDQALEEFRTLDTDMQTDRPTFFRLFEGSSDRGLVLIKTGTPDSALEELELATKRVRNQYGENYFAVSEVNCLTAMALSESGRWKEALPVFHNNTDKLISRWRNQSTGNASAVNVNFRLALIVEAYLDVLHKASKTGTRLPGGSDPASEAFSIAAAFQDRSVSKALAASAARRGIQNAALADMIRKRQNLELRLAAHHHLYSQALSAPKALQNRSALTQRAENIHLIQDAMEVLDGKIRSEFPDYHQMVAPPAIDLKTLQGSLKTEEALVTFFVGERQTFVWACRNTGPVAFFKLSLGREELSAEVAALRNALEPENVVFLSDIPDFDVDRAYRLYQKILAPAEAVWVKSSRLIIVADGPLGLLPFSLLPTAPTQVPPRGEPVFSNYRSIPWLVRTHAVTYQPSTISLVQMRAKNMGSPGKHPFVGFGDPLFARGQGFIRGTSLARSTEPELPQGRGVRCRTSPKTRALYTAGFAQLPPLPETGEELIAIAEALGVEPGKTVFLGNRATETRIKTMRLDGYARLAFATHGLVAGDLDGLTEPALALSSPEVTGENEDGLLTMGEILGLKLNADWVVLSACNTAAAEGAGAEAVSGLGKAFFFAGARALLLTSWAVETTSARELTVGLFQRQGKNPKLSRAEALRQTKVALIDGRVQTKGISEPLANSYAHPIFWAPYILMGEGGGDRIP